MKNVLIALSLLTLLGGCATISAPPTPRFEGPTAILRDSMRDHGSSKADIFFVSAIDGVLIDNSLLRTRISTRGHGLRMMASVIQREVPARQTAFIVIGRTEYAAPILSLIGTVHQVQGLIKFSPEPGKTYVVKGELNENNSSIWIEEEKTKTIVGEKIVVNGSNTLE